MQDVITCGVNMVRIKMGKNTLILVQGDRLTISKFRTESGRRQVCKVNDRSVTPFVISEETIRKIRK